MPKKPMNITWLVSSLAGLTALGTGAYLSGRYNAQHTWNKYQQEQSLSQNPRSKNPVDLNQHGKPPKEDTIGKERTSTWSSTGDTIFAFGDQGRYFLTYRNEPNGTNWFLKTMGTTYGIMNTGLKDRITRPYFYTWTPAGDELLGYMDSVTNQPAWEFRTDPNRPPTAPTYTSLLHWLSENVKTESDMLQTKIVFGSKATYFAQNGKKCTFHDLPPTLHNFLLEKKYAMTDPGGNPPHSWIPRIIALGPSNTFIAIWSDGDKLSSLSANTPSIAPLTAEMTKSSSKYVPNHQYENIVLSPFSVASYFRIKKTGHIAWSMAASDDTHLDLVTHVGLYSQVRAKEDGTTFNVDLTSKGVTRDLEISPETNHGEGDVRGALRKQETVAGSVSGIVGRVKALIW